MSITYKTGALMYHSSWVLGSIMSLSNCLHGVMVSLFEYSMGFPGFL